MKIVRWITSWIRSHVPAISMFLTGVAVKLDQYLDEIDPQNWTQWAPIIFGLIGWIGTESFTTSSAKVGFSKIWSSQTSEVTVPVGESEPT